MNDMPPVTRPITRDEVIAAADRTQRQASDPRASVFVSASAGSGKTKLLIDRLLRSCCRSMCRPRTATPFWRMARIPRVSCA